MLKKTSNFTKAIIILHEIYGVNHFMEDLCSAYHSKGFDIYCPNMLGRENFPYNQEQIAYDFFVNGTGFDNYKEVESLLHQLKDIYDRVLIIGFSVGATIAWRSVQNTNCDGIICIYGSRIRDYLELIPACPVLLIFAENDWFDVDSVSVLLKKKPNIVLHTLPASHGFIDHYSPAYDKDQALIANKYIEDFLTRC